METNNIPLYTISYYTRVTDGGVIINEHSVASYKTNIRPIIPRIGETVLLHEYGTQYRVVDIIYTCDYDENTLIEDQNINTDIAIYVNKEESL